MCLMQLTSSLLKFVVRFRYIQEQYTSTESKLLIFAWLTVLVTFLVFKPSFFAKRNVCRGYGIKLLSQKIAPSNGRASRTHTEFGSLSSVCHALSIFTAGLHMHCAKLKSTSSWAWFVGRGRVMNAWFYERVLPSGCGGSATGRPAREVDGGKGGVDGGPGGAGVDSGGAEVDGDGPAAGVSCPPLAIYRTDLFANHLLQMKRPRHLSFVTF